MATTKTTTEAADVADAPAAAERAPGRGFGRRFGAEEVEPAHILLWGESGVGKTAAAVRASIDRRVDLDEALDGRAEMQGDPGIFLLINERNGLDTARAVNPLLSYELVEADEDTALTRIGEVFRWAASGAASREGFHTLVLDGLSELQRIVKDDIAAGLARERSSHFSQDDWGYLNERMRKMLRTIRALPLRVVATALEDTRESGPDGAVRVTTQAGFEGRKTGGEAGQFFTAVARAERWTVTDGHGQDVDRYAATFSAPSGTRVKRCLHLRGRVVPCAAAWLDVLAGKLTRADIAWTDRDATVADDGLRSGAAQPARRAGVRR